MTDQQTRELHWKLKLAHKQIGKQGDTIYNQRAIIEELHSLISKESRGVTRRIQAQYDDLYADHQQALEEIDRLHNRLAHASLREMLAGSEI
jgi:FMN phosphatase YigB (HAD superfamily)